MDGACYRVLAHCTCCLQQFSACDYQFDALWSKLSSIFGETFHGTPWTREGQDIWVQKVSR